MKGKNHKLCSFCERGAAKGIRMISGPGGHICEDCVEMCRKILQQEGHLEGVTPLKDIPTPKEIKTYLDGYVIGQDQAKKILSVAVYNHYKRLLLTPQLSDGVVLEKANVLLIGPTGTGKTLLARTLAKRLQVPFVIADATTLTEAGYVGEDVENILLKLIQNADGDIQAAERGIIYIDEIDKISRKSENVSITRDVSGEGVQQALLKIIEGTVASVPPQGGRKHPNQGMIRIRTDNILIICGGAFVGLDRIIESRVSQGMMGFGAPVNTQETRDLARLYAQVQPDDLIKFGLIPEFIGRLPIQVALNELTKKDLMRIIREPHNSVVKQYEASLQFDKVDLVFEDAAIEMIADMAIQREVGARGVRTIVEKAMMEIMYNLPSLPGEKQVVVTPEVIRDGRDPLLLPSCAKDQEKGIA